MFSLRLWVFGHLQDCTHVRLLVRVKCFKTFGSIGKPFHQHFVAPTLQVNSQFYEPTKSRNSLCQVPMRGICSEGRIVGLAGGSQVPSKCAAKNFSSVPLSGSELVISPFATVQRQKRSGALKTPPPSHPSLPAREEPMLTPKALRDAS